MLLEKRCAKCLQIKPIEEFPWRDSAHTRPQSYCGPCQRESWRRWYADERNRERHKRQVGRRRKRRNVRNKQLVKRLKSQPCADCGRSFPWYVMDFDHTGEKTGEVSSFVFTYSTDRLLAEVKLCEVVCANCHRVRTYRRLDLA